MTQEQIVKLKAVVTDLEETVPLVYDLAITLEDLIKSLEDVING